MKRMDEMAGEKKSPGRIVLAEKDTINDINIRWDE